MWRSTFDLYLILVPFSGDVEENFDVKENVIAGMDKFVASNLLWMHL